MSKKTLLGFMKKGQYFLLDGVKYKVGHLIDGTDGYVACTDIKTKKVERVYIDTLVEKVEEKKE